MEVFKICRGESIFVGFRVKFPEISLKKKNEINYAQKHY